jgi:hypothetical protein
MEFVAVRTIKFLIDLSRKRLATFLAEGLREARQVSIAAIAQSPPV